MKRVGIFFSILFVSIQLFGQVTRITSVPPKKSPIAPIVFDSSLNFLGKTNVGSYKGQIVYGIPRHVGFRKPELNKGVDWPYNESDYSNLYFRIDSVYPCYSKNGIINRYTFEMTRNDSTRRRIQYVYDTEKETFFPFMVVSHLNWLKKQFVGKRFIIKNSRFILHNDILTGDSIAASSRIPWKVTEISLYDWGVRQEFVCVLTDGKYTTLLPVEYFEQERISAKRTIFEKNEWDKLVSKYGLSVMSDVLSNKIRVGMPKQLLIMSWGNPQRINSASYGDQYVYNGQYVYVKGGKVTSWN